MKKINTEDFRIRERVQLSELPTLFELDASNKVIEKKTARLREKLSELQDVMYAQNKYSVLICLQGMDTAGKDSLIREVFKEFNPRGVVVQSFKAPNSRDLKHDYLWRHYIALPEKGKFTVFNRSHYENVLISRVHPEFVVAENIPGIERIEDIPEDFWKERIQQINNFEKHIVQNGIIVLKFFLNLSKEEQRLRLLRRLEEEKHNWKFSPDDLKERESWDLYQQCYEEAVNETSKKKSPWFIIPADNKETARYIVAKIIWEEMKRYKDIKEPELSDEIKAKFTMYKKQLGD